MPRFWARLFTSATLVAIGVFIGIFATDRQYHRASEAPLAADSYVRHSACPTQTLSRVDTMLTEDGTTVPQKARRDLQETREELIARICPPAAGGEDMDGS